MGAAGGDSGDDRLSRLWHYHGPGGLNGRVRDGNGWDPAGVVAGEAAAGRAAPPRSRGLGWWGSARRAGWGRHAPDGDGTLRLGAAGSTGGPRGPAEGRRAR